MCVEIFFHLSGQASIRPHFFPGFVSLAQTSASFAGFLGLVSLKPQSPASFAGLAPSVGLGIGSSSSSSKLVSEFVS